MIDGARLTDWLRVAWPIPVCPQWRGAGIARQHRHRPCAADYGHWWWDAGGGPLEHPANKPINQLVIMHGGNADREPTHHTFGLRPATWGTAVLMNCCRKWSRLQQCIAIIIRREELRRQTWTTSPRWVWRIRTSRRANQTQKSSAAKRPSFPCATDSNAKCDLQQGDTFEGSLKFNYLPTFDPDPGVDIRADIDGCPEIRILHPVSLSSHKPKKKSIASKCFFRFRCIIEHVHIATLVWQKEAQMTANNS